MSLDLRRGATWAVVFFLLYIPGHLFLMPWLADRYPLFDRWNYSPAEAWAKGAMIALLGGLVFAIWNPEKK